MTYEAIHISVEHVGEGLQVAHGSAEESQRRAQQHNRLRVLVVGAVRQALLFFLGQGLLHCFCGRRAARI